MFSFPPPSIAERLAEERRHDLLHAARKRPEGPPGPGPRRPRLARSLGAFLLRPYRSLVRAHQVRAGQTRTLQTPAGQMATGHPGAVHTSIAEHASTAIAIAQRAHHQE
jgi:hypothetical protein